MQYKCSRKINQHSKNALTKGYLRIDKLTLNQWVQGSIP